MKTTGREALEKDLELPIKTDIVQKRIEFFFC